jgi:hypothetical protein
VDFVTEDKWTGNAGLVVLRSVAGYRSYGCSDGIGEFDPEDLKFELTWEEQNAQPEKRKE